MPALHAVRVRAQGWGLASSVLGIVGVMGSGLGALRVEGLWVLGELSSRVRRISEGEGMVLGLGLEVYELRRRA